MTRILYRRADRTIDATLPVEDLPNALADPQGLVWVDFLGEPDMVCEAILRETFHFHPLAIDDAIKQSHVPKVDDWDSYLYLVLHAVSFTASADQQLSTHELDIFAGRNYIVTHHEEAIEPLDAEWASCLRDQRLTVKGAEHLLYQIVDQLVASHMPVVDAIDEEVERIEEQILSSPTPATLQQVLRIKRALMNLRRIVAPQREVLNKLARDQFASIDPASRIYFRDVYDHLVRLYDITENMRDLAGSALETYLSVINNSLNEVMKALTLITTLFMPLSFLAGFFGMNFFAPAIGLAGWTGRVSFGISLGAFVLVPCAMYLWWKRRRWL